jgi:hypothetical protein
MQHHDDGGGIYTLGWMKNTVINDNFITETKRYSAPDGYPVVGIYLDQGSRGKTVRNNVMAQMGTGVQAFSATNGPIRDNLFTGNYFKGEAGKIVPWHDTYPGDPSVPGCSNPDLCNQYDSTNLSVPLNGAWPSAAVNIMNNSGRQTSP